MRRGLAFALSLLTALSPLELSAAPALRAPVRAAAAPAPALAVGVRPLAPAAAPAALAIRLAPSRRAVKPIVHADISGSMSGSKTAADTLFDGRGGTLTQNGARELLRLRRDVQMDARTVLREQMSGDVGDGRLHRDVERVARRLVTASGLPKEAAQVFVGNSILPNGFTTITKSEASFIEKKASIAKPFRVANVFLSLGLLRALDDEHQLAFIIAHELAHNWKEHLKGLAGSHEMLGHFHEFEADATALKIMAKAGYDPRRAVDTLYALDRAMDRLAKEYGHLRRSEKNSLTAALERMRDVHPHNDLRRAFMLDHIDEAVELYKPAPVPDAPDWKTRSAAAERPSALDRFEARVRGAAAGEGHIDERLHRVEDFVERVKAKQEKEFAPDQKAIVEEAYRDVVRSGPDLQDTRTVELSVKRGGVADPKAMRGELVTRQLDLVIGRGTTLEDFLSASAALSPETRRAGTLRLLGGVRDRRALDAAYRALTHGAESLGLDPTLHSKDTAGRLWAATRRVLSAEKKRAARPEEIIDELRRSLSPAWLRAHYDALHIDIIESAFGPEAGRSAVFTPSQLGLRLRGLNTDHRDKGIWPNLYAGLSLWNDRHYTAGTLGFVNGRVVHRYERFRVDGLAAPSERDFLDLFERFSDGGTPKPAMVAVLRRQGLLDRYLLAALGRMEERLLEAEKSGVSMSVPVQTYVEGAHKLLTASLAGVSDLGEAARLAELMWGRVEETSRRMGDGWRKTLEGSFANTREEMAAGFLKALSGAARASLLRLNAAGARPRDEDVRRAVAVAARVEAAFGVASSRETVLAHAGALEKALARGRWRRNKAYLRAMFSALPKLRKDDLKIWFSSHSAPRLLASDLLGMLALSVDGGVPSGRLVAAAALADKLSVLDYSEYHGGMMGYVSTNADELLSRGSAHAVGRWLMERAVASAVGHEQLTALSEELLRVNDLQPGFLAFDMPSRVVSKKKGMREGADVVRRNEPLRALARQEHPFRGVSSRWALALLGKLDAAKAWPAGLPDRLDLLDLMNSTGEFDETLDRRILAEAGVDEGGTPQVAGFAEWRARDEKRLEAWGESTDRSMNTPLGSIVVPYAAPLRLVRNPALRTRLFDVLPESRLAERAPRRGLVQTYRAYRALWRAYRKARKYIGARFLLSLRDEGSLESKYYLVLAEIDRAAREEFDARRRRWDKGDFDRKEREEKVDGQPFPQRWAELREFEREKLVAERREAWQAEALGSLVDLYMAYAAAQDPLLGLILANYPEPTRSRDELLERVIKARRLTPGALSFLEGHKSYRQPNPVRAAEKQLLDQAVLNLRRFSPADRVDILLHMGGLEVLPRERVRELDRKFLRGDRLKLAKEKAALRSMTQLKGYLTLLHPKDRALLTRALFFGEDSLHKDPAQVQRLYETLVIKDRKLPPFLEEVLRAYFRALTDDEKAVLIASLAAEQESGRAMSGPQVLRVALKAMGVTGAKVAQVLATHRGLLPEEYAVELARFKDRAQDMDKAFAYGAIKERLDKLAGGDAPAVDMKLKELLELADEALPKEGDASRWRLARQVRYILRQDGAAVRRVQKVGTELGTGSIKVVYKVELDDGRTWVVKLRAPGAARKTEREFRIIEAVVADLEASGTLDMPGVRQLVDEVRGLVKAEMDFRDEAAKETATRDRAKARPWYARLLIGPSPYVPDPHPVYVGEDLLVEEFVPVTRFDDLPERSWIGPSKRSIARRAIDEASYALVHDEWLEPDAHEGNRFARRGLLGYLFPRLVMIDLGQGVPFPVERLKPLMRAGLAAKSGDVARAADELLATMTPGREPAKVRAAVEASLRAATGRDGTIERLMDAYIAAEKEGALVKPEYAALQKAYLINAGAYARYLPADGLYASLERAVVARLLRDGKMGWGELLVLGARRLLWGSPRASVLAALVNRL